MAHPLKSLPSFDDVFGNEPGVRPSTDKPLTALMAQHWPDNVSEGLRGQALFANAADTEQLTQLFAAFGCKADAAAAPYALVWNAYGMFTLVLSRWVDHLLRHPETDVDRYLDDWSQDWRVYVVAVASRDLKSAERLFARLQPLDADSALPPGCTRRKDEIR